MDSESSHESIPEALLRVEEYPTLKELGTELRAEQAVDETILSQSNLLNFGSLLVESGHHGSVGNHVQVVAMSVCHIFANFLAYRANACHMDASVLHSSNDHTNLNFLGKDQFTSVGCIG